MNTSQPVTQKMQKDLREFGLKLDGMELTGAREHFDDMIENANTATDMLFGMMVYADLLVQHKKFDWALEQYEQALHIAKDNVHSNGNPDAEINQKKTLVYVMAKYAIFLNDLSKKFNLKDKPLRKKALALLYGALGMSYQINDIGLINSVYQGLIDLQGVSVLFLEAREAYDNVAAFPEVQHKIATTEFYARILSEKGLHEEAVVVLNKAIPLAQSLGVSGHDAVCRLVISKVKALTALGKMEEALTGINEAVNLSCDTQIYALQCKSDIEFTLGRIEDAIDTMGNVFDLARGMQSRELETFAVISLATLFCVNKSFDRAENVIDTFVGTLDEGMDQAFIQQLQTVRVGVGVECQRG